MFLNAYVVIGKYGSITMSPVPSRLTHLFHFLIILIIFFLIILIIQDKVSLSPYHLREFLRVIFPIGESVQCFANRLAENSIAFVR